MIYAFDKITNRYVPVSKGVKGIKYNSGCCNGEVIFCKGSKVSPYFRHIDEKSTCNGGINNEGESRIHKEAKNIITDMINRNKEIKFTKQCNMCLDDHSAKYKVENGKIIQEYSFDFNGSKKIADIACVDGENINFVIEIKNTHATKEEDRFGDWCEFSAEEILTNPRYTINQIDIIPVCLRYYICINCKFRIEEEEMEQIIYELRCKKRIEEEKEKEIECKKQQEQKDKKKQEIDKYYKDKKEKELKQKELDLKQKEEERNKKWNDEAPIREAEKQKQIEKRLKEEKNQNERIKKINDEAHLRELERIQLQKDIIELWGEHNADMIAYIEPNDVVWKRNFNKQCEETKKRNNKKDEYGESKSWQDSDEYKMEGGESWF
jgi:hypothetical protein